MLKLLLTHQNQKFNQFLRTMFDKKTPPVPVSRALRMLNIFTFAAMAAIIVAMTFYTGYKEGCNDAARIPTEQSISIESSTEDAFEEGKFKEYLQDLNVKFPHIVYAQAVLETGRFSSKIFRNNNNLFGMKEARQRATTNAGTELGHAVYNNWRESVVDYALYQCAFLSKIRTEEAYYAYLRENYAEDPNYIRLVHKIADQAKTSLNSKS